METLAWPPGPDREPAFLARRFGSRPDHLDLDLAGTNRARAVTSVLAACLLDRDGEQLDDRGILEATVSWRLQGLLATAAATAGFRLDAEGDCPEPDCREPLDLALDLRSFAAADFPERIAWREGGGDLVLRLPTGSDQERWCGEPPGDFAAMAASLVVEVAGGPRPERWEVPEPWLEALSQRLGEADPLTDLRIESRCPACGRDTAMELDLEAMLLASLAKEQKRLFRDIHRLASAYHWSEAEILALSPGRRARYLAKLEEGL